MSYIFYSSVDKPFRYTEEILEWAKDNCPSYITNDVERREDGQYYRFYFYDEKDYMMCLLRWT